MTKADKLVEAVYKNPEKIDLLMEEVLNLFLKFETSKLTKLVRELQNLVDKLEYTIDLTSYYNVTEVLMLLPVGSYFESIAQLQSSLLQVKSEGNLYLESIIYGLQGLAYRSLGEGSMALSFHFQSNDLIKENITINNLKFFNNYHIGELYAENGDYTEAKNFLLESLKDDAGSVLEDSFFFRLYSGLVNICILENNEVQAKKYLKCAEKYYMYSDVNTSRYYSDLSSYYFLIQAYDLAIEQENKSLNLREKSNAIDSISSCHIMLGKCYLAKKNSETAIFHALKAFELCKKLKTKNKLLRVHKLLSDIYKNIGNYETAFSHLEKFTLLKDEIKIKQNKRNYVLKNKMLLAQKDEFEETINELSASIKYAERIQRAMMLPAKNLATLLPESFIFLKPHSVISGDFYWFASVNNKIIIAAADCTGHGVPAGLLTMKLHGLLTRLIIELKHTVPNEILVNLHQKLHFDLDYDNSLIEDGMDVSIVSIDKQLGEIQYAGAKRPLVIVEGGAAKIINADRKSIGGQLPENLTFKNHTLPISKSANYFMYSDGYTDQFGGEKDKKYKTSNLIQLLQKNHSKSMAEHSKELEKSFMAWRGFGKRKLTPQTDDVLVIGFQIKD